MIIQAMNCYLGQGGGGGAEPAFWQAFTRVAIRTTVGAQNITVSGLSWTPKYVRIIANEQTVGGGIPSIRAGSVGASDGTTQGLVRWKSSDSGHRTNAIVSIDGGVTAGFSAFVAGGVEISVTVASTGAGYSLTVILMGGTDFSAKVGNANMATQNNAVSPSVGFQPNALFIDSAFSTSGGDTTQGYTAMGVASYDGSTIRQAGNFFRRNTTTANLGIITGVNVMPFLSSRFARITAVGATDFDLTTLGADLSTVAFTYSALNFGGEREAWAGIVDSPTATGVQPLPITASSFTPSFGYVIPTMQTALETDETTGKGGVFGVSAVGTNHDASTFEAMNFWRDRDGATGESAEASDVSIRFRDHTDATAFDATFDSFDVDEINHDFTNADGTTRKWAMLAIGA